MKRSMYSIIFLLFISVLCSAQSKSPAIVTLSDSVIQRLESTSSEKLLIQTDKSIYGIGERIWFKVFIVDSLSNRMLYKDKFLFVDIVNNEDSVIYKLYLNASKFQTSGFILIQDTLLHGLYWIRAYTDEVLNSNIENIALHPVYIFDNNNKKVIEDLYVKEKVAEISKPIIEIYPEGGALISGANSLVVLKVHDQKGYPLRISGLIKDKRNAEVANFATNYLGFAKFNFLPTSFGRYSIFLQNGKGYDSVSLLPQVDLHAAQISIQEQKNGHIKTRVMLEDSIYTNEYLTYLLCISRGKVCFASVGRGMYQLEIPIINFPSGEAALLLFDERQKLLSERDVYIEKKDGIVRISTNKQSYAPRENVKMEITVADADSLPLQSTLAMSITDNRMDDALNMFYRDSLENLSEEDADIIMVTQKQLTNVLSNSRVMIGKQAIKNNLNTLKLKGKIINTKGEPVAAVRVSLFSIDKNAFASLDTTDSKGRFSFALPDFYDSTEFKLQLNNKNGVKVEFAVIIDSAEFPSVITPRILKEKAYLEKNMLLGDVHKLEIDSIFLNNKARWLKPVVVTSANVANRKSRKSADNSIITSEMLQQHSYNDVGLEILNSGKFHLLNGYLVAGGPVAFSPSAADEPIIVMDGVEVAVSQSDPTNSPVLGFLKTLQTQGIDYIKILNGADGSTYGLRGGHGVIEIHTSSKYVITASSSGIISLYPKGFQAPAAYTMPDYTRADIKGSKIADLRTTLFWNGNIIDGVGGRATINFFTSDVPSNLIVTISGMTVRGDRVFKKYAIGK